MKDRQHGIMISEPGTPPVKPTDNQHTKGLPPKPDCAAAPDNKQSFYPKNIPTTIKK